jgi:transmembrane sensor
MMPLDANQKPEQPALSRQVLEQAVDWLLQLQTDRPDASLLTAFEHWHASHPQHAHAWARLGEIQKPFGQVTHKAFARQVLSHLAQTERRSALKKLGTLGLLLPSAWLGYRALPLERWGAEYQTAVGEQQQLSLDDGTRLVLNTDSAVDIQYHAQRQIVLRQGEIWVETGHRDKRALVVVTPHGRLVPLGTRFNVKLNGDQTRLAVTEGAVRIQLANGQSTVVNASEQRAFGKDTFEQAVATDQGVGYWQQGMLLAQDMPVGDLLKELARYRHGVIRCHPDLKRMTVSGAFPLKDTDAALDLLQKTLPVRVVAPSRYWIMVEPAATAG